MSVLCRSPSSPKNVLPNGYRSPKRLPNTECEVPFGVARFKEKKTAAHTISDFTEFLHGPATSKTPLQTETLAIGGPVLRHCRLSLN